MKPSFLGILDGGGKGYMFIFPFSYICTIPAATVVVFMDIIPRPLFLSCLYFIS